MNYIRVFATLVAFSPLAATTAIAITRSVTASGGDDTAAITSAINLSSIGDTVYLNPGTFRISSTLAAKTGVAIVGAGKASTAVQYIGGAGSAMLNLGGVSNVEIANLTLNGNNVAGNAITAWSGSRQNIHDTAIQDLGAHAIGIYFLSDVTDSAIVNNQLSNIGVGSEWGAGVRMSWGSSRNQVIGNTITNAGRGGIFGNDGSADLVIRNNTITGSGSGGTGLGIEIWNACDRSIIQNNSVDQWLSVDRSSRVAVRNNTVNGGYAGMELAGGADNVFAGNTVNNAYIGISVSTPAMAKERVLWANNDIHDSAAWGAQIMSEDATGAVRQMYFYGNTFEGSAQAGFRFFPNYPVGSIENVVLDNNTISGNSYGVTGGDWGPDPAPRLEKLSVINNRIINNSLAAFSGSMGAMPPDGFYGNQLRWQNNTVTGNGANNQPPSEGTFFNTSSSVSIVGPSVVSPGSLAAFSLSYGGASPLGGALWDLGEGLPLTSSNASITYTVPGIYWVGLVAWDTQGRGAHDELELIVAKLGDTDFDNDVDLNDLGNLATSYGALAGASWMQGDFDRDGDVDLNDLGTLATYYGAGQAQFFADLQTLVPEPSVGLMMWIGLPALRCRRTGLGSP